MAVVSKYSRNALVLCSPKFQNSSPQVDPILSTFNSVLIPRISISALSSDLLQWSFPNKSVCIFLASPSMPTALSFYYWFNHENNCRWRVQILHICQPTCYLFSCSLWL